MEVIFEETFFTKFRKLVKLQNILLLSIIAKDNGWDLKELKKKYLRDKLTKKPKEIQEIPESQEIKLVLKKKKTKDKSPNTKKFIKEQLDNSGSVKENKNSKIENNNKNYKIENNNNDINEDIEISNDLNCIKCKKYSFMDNIYYVSNKNYVYDDKGDFVGIMEDECINFDGEESMDDE